VQHGDTGKICLYVNKNNCQTTNCIPVHTNGRLKTCTVRSSDLKPILT